MTAQPIARRAGQRSEGLGLLAPDRSFDDLIDAAPDGANLVQQTTPLIGQPQHIAGNVARFDLTRD